MFLEKHFETIEKQSSPETRMIANADFIGGVANATIVLNIKIPFQKAPLISGALFY